MSKIFIYSENLRGRRPVTRRIAGKDPQTIIIINCILSTALLPDNTTGETFHHDGRADIGSQFIHRFLVCCHLLCDIQRRTFSSVFQRVFDQRFNVGINTRFNFELIGTDGYLVLRWLITLDTKADVVDIGHRLRCFDCRCVDSTICDSGVLDE